MSSNAALASRACRYCGRAHPVSDYVAEESPFCATCLPERIAKRAATHGEVSLETVDGSLIVRSSPPGTPYSERARAACVLESRAPTPPVPFVGDPQTSRSKSRH